MQKTIPAGTKMYLGAPAKPMSSELVAKIVEMLRVLPGVVECHLPQCYAPKIVDPSAQVLVVVKGKRSELDLAENLKTRLSTILAPGVFLDYIVVDDNFPLLDAIRRTSCKIL